MQSIDKYITLPKEERQKHLALDEPCIERGGPKKGGLSCYCKGLLAHVLNTTIPSGNKIHVCHACNNENCSNPKHLYWGTAKENIVEDGLLYGTWQPLWDKIVAKYGYEEACKLNSKRQQGNRNGIGNKGKAKSEEHKKNISLALLEKKKLGTPSNAGRKRKMPYEDLIAMVQQYGLIKTSEILNESFEATKSRYYSARKKLLQKEI